MLSKKEKAIINKLEIKINHLMNKSHDQDLKLGTLFRSLNTSDAQKENPDEKSDMDACTPSAMCEKCVHGIVIESEIPPFINSSSYRAKAYYCKKNPACKHFELKED